MSRQFGGGMDYVIEGFVSGIVKQYGLIAIVAATLPAEAARFGTKKVLNPSGPATKL